MNPYKKTLCQDCGACEKEFHSQKAFRKHFKVHEDDVITECKKCKKEFPNKVRAQAHKARAHEEVPVQSCNTCQKQFSKENLNGT